MKTVCKALMLCLAVGFLCTTTEAKVLNLEISMKYKNHAGNPSLQEIALESELDAKSRGPIDGATMALQAVNAAMAASYGYEYEIGIKATIEIVDKTIKNYRLEGMEARLDMGEENASLPPNVDFHAYTIYIQNGKQRYIKSTDLKTNQTFEDIREDGGPPPIGGNFITLFNALQKHLDKIETYQKNDASGDSYDEYIIKGDENNIPEALLVDKNEKWVKWVSGAITEPRSFIEMTYNNSASFPSSFRYYSRKSCSIEYTILTVNDGDETSFEIPKIVEAK